MYTLLNSASLNEVCQIYHPLLALIGEFADKYGELDYTRHAIVGKLLFLVYMVLVTLLLINMLIALMGNTYTKINAASNEGLRQWARIVLAVEQTVSPCE